MIANLVLALALVLLFSAWISSFFDRRVRSIPIWRRIVSWVALVALTVSLIELLHSSDVPGNAGRLAAIAPFAKTGLVLTGVAFLTCWFSTWKTLACLLSSTILVGLSWFFELLRP